MTKVILNNQQNRQLVFDTYEQCHKALKVSILGLKDACENGTTITDKNGNKWYIDELVEEE